MSDRMRYYVRLFINLKMWLTIAGVIIALWLSIATVRCLWLLRDCTLFSPRFFEGSVKFLTIWALIAVGIAISEARRLRRQHDETIRMVRDILDGRVRRRVDPDDHDTR